MKIAIIGTGNVGSALAGPWAKAGHTITIAGRDPEKARSKAKDLGVSAASPRDAAAAADVVLFAVPSASLIDAAREAGDLRGKLLIDATNVVGPAARTSESPALALARAVPGAKVVKAFNTEFAQILPEALGAPEKPSQVLVGDDAAAKATVRVLIEQAGYQAFDAGGLELAPDLEGFARIVIALAYGPSKTGPFFYYFKR